MNRPLKNERSGVTGEINNQPLPPAINLPKGSGAIHGIDEKSQAKPANSSASLAISVAVSLARGGRLPDLVWLWQS